MVASPKLWLFSSRREMSPIDASPEKKLAPLSASICEQPLTCLLGLGVGLPPPGLKKLEYWSFSPLRRLVRYYPQAESWSSFPKAFPKSLPNLISAAKCLTPSSTILCSFSLSRSSGLKILLAPFIYGCVSFIDDTKLLVRRLYLPQTRPERRNSPLQQHLRYRSLPQCQAHRRSYTPATPSRLSKPGILVLPS